MHREGTRAEARDAGEDVVGQPGPAERLRLGVVPLDIGQHRRLEFLDRAVHLALEPTRREQREETLDSGIASGPCLTSSRTVKRSMAASSGAKATVSRSATIRLRP